MFTPKAAQNFAYLSLICASFWAAACGIPADRATNPGTVAAAQSCAPLSAAIAIGDGFSKIICGCAEPAGQVIASNRGSTTCTVQSGTVMTFQFIAIAWRHQIAPRNGALFPASQVLDGVPRVALRVHGFKLTQPGNYDFADTFDSGINGTIVVQ